MADRGSRFRVLWMTMITQTSMNESLSSPNHAQPGWRLTSLWKGRAGWHLDRWGQLLPLIEDYERQYREKSDQHLRKESLALRVSREGGRVVGIVSAPGVCLGP